MRTKSPTGRRPFDRPPWFSWLCVVILCGLDGTREARAEPVARPAAVDAQSVARQGVPQWSDPIEVWATDGHTASPKLTVDSSGLVHLFFIDTTVGDPTLYHVQLRDDGTNVPNDVMVGVGDYRIAADNRGRIHLIYDAGNLEWKHRHVLGSEAGDPLAWSRPAFVARATTGAAFDVDRNGVLHFCFPRGDEVRYIRSENGGDNWGYDYMVGATEFGNIATYLACTADETGMTHAAWNIASPPNYLPTQQLLYANSTDGGATWSPAEPIADEHYTLPYLQADFAGTVHFVWQGDATVGGRYYQSRPAGEGSGWTPSIEISPAGEGGMSGNAPVAADSNGNPHVVTASQGIKWIGRVGGGWQAPVQISGGVTHHPDRPTSVEYPTLAVVNGNRLYAAWEVSFARIYYATANLDAPFVSSEPTAADPADGPAIDESPDASAVTPDRPTTAEAVGPPTAMPDFGKTLDPIGKDTWLRILVGPVVAGMFVIGMVVRHLRRQPHRRRRK